MVTAVAYVWFEDARRVSVRDVAAELGRTVRRTGFGPCPACGAAHRGSDDKRPPVLAIDGWRCVRCNEKGDGVALAALVLVGDKRPPASRWSEVRAWFAARGWCDPETGGPQPPPVRPVVPVAAPPPPEPSRPPPAEVAALWDACGTVKTYGAPGGRHDPCRWLWARGFCESWIAEMDLARGLPVGTACPSWAQYRGQTWADAGYRLILRAFDERGNLASLVARWTRFEDFKDDRGEMDTRAVPPPDKWPKSLNARGGSIRGLAFANPMGRWLLERGPDASPGEGSGGPLSWDGSVWLVEGHTDLLRLATASDRVGADNRTPAVLGYVQGSWTPALAARLPATADVVVLPDADPNGKGEQMAAAVVATLDMLVTRPVVLRADEILNGGVDDA